MVGGTAGNTKNPPVAIPNVKELHDFEFHDNENIHEYMTI